MSDYLKHLTPLNKTAILPLCCRYFEAKEENSLLHDPYALQLGEKLACDMLTIEPGIRTNALIKTLLIDEQVRQFIAQNKEAVIINLACGFDSRYFRVNNGKITWYEIDLPEIITYRKSVIPETEQYIAISHDILDYAWMNLVKKDKPVLIIAEAILMYFTEEQVRLLFTKIQKTFTHAALLFDVVSPQVVKQSGTHRALKSQDLAYSWGISHTKDFSFWINNIQERKQMTIHEGLKKYSKKWNLYHLLYRIPHVRNANKIILIRY